MTDTIIAGVIVAGLSVTMGGLTFVLMLWVWSDFQDWRDKRRYLQACKWCGGRNDG